MAGFIAVCARRGETPHAADLARLALHLAPDNIRPNPPHVVAGRGMAWAVLNPVPGLDVRANGVCLGALFERADWAQPQGTAPDGSFALLRYDDSCLELVTDLHGSRSIWYVFTDTLFLASTSQRALIALLGDFQPQPEAVTWMIASGGLGPRCGWDRRLHRVPSGTQLTLHRDAWRLSSMREEVRYVPEDLPDDEHLARLWRSIFATCRGLDLSHTPSVLALSGGTDSRALLMALTDLGRPPDCVTWGFASSLDDPQNDAAIARRLAERYGRSFQYFVTDRSTEPLRDVLTRFLKAGEGRVEDFGSYADGFETWRRLFAEGLGAYLRGDAPGVGHDPPINDFVTRAINLRLTLMEDYPEGDLVRRLGLAPQHLEEADLHRDDESLDGYEGRMMVDFYTPVFQAPLLDLKAGYLEPINPLLGRAVTLASAALPDRLLKLREGYERLMATLVPDIPFAQHPADAVSEQYLEWPEMLAELLEELSSDRARQALPTAAPALLTAELERPVSVQTAKLRLRGQVRRMVPRRVVRALRPVPRCRLDARQAAWRAYIVSRTHALLREDAVSLAAPAHGAARSVNM